MLSNPSVEPVLQCLKYSGKKIFKFNYFLIRRIVPFSFVRNRPKKLEIGLH